MDTNKLNLITQRMLALNINCKFIYVGSVG